MSDVLSVILPSIKHHQVFGILRVYEISDARAHSFIRFENEISMRTSCEMGLFI